MSDIKIDQIIHSRRRSIALVITQEAKLIVRAPHFTSHSYINKIVQDRRQWIIQKQEHFRSKPIKRPKQYIAGEQFLFLGKLYTLEVVDDLPKAVLLDNTLKISGMVINNAREHMLNWYQEEALNYISPRTRELAQANQINYQSLKVNDAKTRWGSCGASGALNFSWRLIMAPPRVIDYVIIHELMHRKELNHSARFWHEVALRIPDYKQDERWLKQNSYQMSL